MYMKEETGNYKKVWESYKKELRKREKKEEGDSDRKVKKT